MSLTGIDSGCKWSGKANQWYTSHHMAREDLGEGRMHARWPTCSTTSREVLEQTTVSAWGRRPEGTEPGKGAGGRIRRGRKRVQGRYVKSAGTNFQSTISSAALSQAQSRVRCGRVSTIPTHSFRMDHSSQGHSHSSRALPAIRWVKPRMMACSQRGHGQTHYCPRMSTLWYM
jgi:hypothetical protein